MIDVVVLAFSSSRSDPIQRRKWRCLREMHTYGTSTSPPSSFQQVGWRYRLDLQHDGVVQRWRVSAAGLRLCAVAGEREIWRAAGRRLGFKEGWRRGAPLPSIYRGLAGPPVPPPSPRTAAPRVGVGGKFFPSF